MAEDYNGYTIGLSVEQGTDSLPRKGSNFVIHDSIYNMFPDFELIFTDISGMALEKGTFLQGVKLVSTVGYEGDLIENSWKVINRETIKEAGSSPYLSGVLKVQALHESFFSNRENPKKGFTKKLASDIVKELFGTEKNLIVEQTKGNIDSYVFTDPYTYVHEVLLSCAHSGKVNKFYFYRNLLNELVFSSFSGLIKGTPVDTLELAAINSAQVDETKIITGFLPFTETLKNKYGNTRCTTKSLSDKLESTKQEFSISMDESDTVPIIAKDKLVAPVYLHRQFNPNVDYESFNKAVGTSKMNYVFDKALVIVPFNHRLVCGKPVELKINFIDEEGNESISEYYSGVWLIEQTFHCWNGSETHLFTKLVISRTGVKPVSNSILTKDSFSK